MVATGINYWAVLVSGVVFTALGALWYSPALFGKAWMAGIGKTKEQIDADYSPIKMLWALIGSLVIAYGIARVLLWRGVFTLQDGLIVGLLAAVCFVGASMAVNDVMEGRSCKLFAVNWLYAVVGFAIMGIIIGAWR